MKREFSRSASLLVTAFLFGALTMLAQVLLLRGFLAVVEENEIFLGLFFSVWFFGIFAGTWVAGIGGSRPGVAGRRLIGMLIVQALALPLLIISLWTIRTTCDLPAAQPLGFGTLLWIALAHLGPFGFMTGLNFPLLCGVARQLGISSSRSLGTIYGLEAAGSLSLGALFTFVLAGRVGSIMLGWFAVAIVFINTAMLWTVLDWAGHRFRKLGLAVIGGLVLFACLTPLPRHMERWMMHRWWRAYGEGITLLEWRETRYQFLALARQAEQYNLLSNGHFMLSFPNRQPDAALANLALAERPAPRRILLIGGSGRGVFRYWLDASLDRIDIVELDPQVTALINAYAPSMSRSEEINTRVHYHFTDGRWFIRQLAMLPLVQHERYDLIVCLVPDPSTLTLNRYYTLQFFEDVRRLLAPEGIFITSLSGAVNYYGSEIAGFIGPVVSALQEVFPVTIPTPGTQMYLISSMTPSQPTDQISTLIARWNMMDLSSEDFSPLAFHTIFEPGQLSFVQCQLKDLAGKALPNSTQHPASTLASMQLWNRLTDSSLGGVLALRTWMRPVPLLSVWIILAVTGWCGAHCSRLSQKKYSLILIYYCIATTGSIGISMSIIVMLSFQSSLGSLYNQLGFLVALFMAGLSIGSYAMRQPDSRSMRNMIITEWTLTLFSIGMAVFLGQGILVCIEQSMALSMGIYYISMMLAGILVGAEFSICGHLYRQLRPNVVQAASRINAADHLGAAFGAFFVSLIFIPALGLTGTLLLCAGVKALGVIFLHGIAAWVRHVTGADREA